MSLRQLESIDAALMWLTERGVRALATDSRRVAAGDAFIAWPGYAVDGRQFVPQALAAGASACLVEAQDADAEPSWRSRRSRCVGCELRHDRMDRDLHGSGSSMRSLRPRSPGGKSS